MAHINAIINFAKNHHWNEIKQKIIDIQNQNGSIEDLNEYVDSNGNNLLHIALQQREPTDIIRQIIDHVNPFNRNYYGELPIHFACSYIYNHGHNTNSLENIKLILSNLDQYEKCEMVNQFSTKYQYNCLHYLISQFSRTINDHYGLTIKITNYLIENGCNVNAYSIESKSSYYSPYLLFRHLYGHLIVNNSKYSQINELLISHGGNTSYVRNINICDIILHNNGNTK